MKTEEEIKKQIREGIEKEFQIAKKIVEEVLKEDERVLCYLKWS